MEKAGAERPFAPESKVLKAIGEMNTALKKARLVASQVQVL